MMLAYGRAIAAIIALAAAALGSEAKAVLWFNQTGTDQLPKRARRIFRGELNESELAELSAAVTKLKRMARKRHQLIHGEWWFNAFENGQLTIRGVRTRRSKDQSWLQKLATVCRVRKKKEDEIVGMKIEHLATISVEDLDGWAQELNQIADVLDNVEHTFRKSRRARSR